MAVGTEDGEIYIWETQEFNLHQKFDSQLSSITAISYSPDGLKLAIGSKDKVFQIIDVKTGMSVFNTSLKSNVCSLKWNDFLLILGCNNGTLLIWDMFEVKLLLEAEAHKGNICHS